MKKNFLVIFGLIILSVIVFRKSFFIFFAQDDFIMITQFSHHKILSDLWNVAGPPKISHWRPLDNFYYFITGNLFSNNYFAYHIFTLLLHISSAYVIYKISLKLFKNEASSVFAGIIYVIHPAFFVSYFWISGGATVIGFFFFVISFYFYLTGKHKISLFLFFLSFLASEAMVSGVLVFIFYKIFLNFKDSKDIFWLKSLLITVFFIVIRFLFLTPKSVTDSYNLDFGFNNFNSVKYYLLQIFGYTDFSHGLFLSAIIFVWLIFLALILLKNGISLKLIFVFSILLSGLFPFIFFPNHLSGHYMNISIFGFSLLIVLALQSLKLKVAVCFIAVFLFLSYLSVGEMYENNWVVDRSKISKQYIGAIKKSNLPEGSTIVFNDNVISSSYEAYVSLGTGKAIDFWFRDKNYKTCFSAFEICETKP